MLGKDINRKDQSGKRWNKLFRIALGQSKMVVRPISGFLHVIVYAGFIIINIEVLEILIDGIFGTHRILSFMGGAYNFLIGSFEILALLVAVACAIFLIRRFILKLKRFQNRELTLWPRSDAAIILTVEILLMVAFLTMNASDSILQQIGTEHYAKAGAFPVSSFLTPFFSGLEPSTLITIERSTWWFHIIGILAFMNYLPYSKHLHIVLSFPNVFYSNLDPKGKFTNMKSVTEMLTSTDFSTPAEPSRFGVKDVSDLTWKNLMDAYSCTECGRCTSECPANITGKLLSPRKIMMDTRDRLEEVGKNIDLNGSFKDDGKALLGNYILPEELWACTTCNACVQACPVNIDPLSIIVDMRRYMVLEESSASAELNNMSNNIQNNGAPWQFSPMDRLNWAQEN